MHRLTPTALPILAVAIMVATATAAPGEPPEVAWTRITAGGDAAAANGVAIDAEGAVYTAGTVPVKGRGTDLVLKKHSADGKLLWRRTLGGAGDDGGGAVALGEGGAVYVTGHARGRLPGQRRGDTGDLVLARYTADGTLTWIRRWGDCNRAFGNDLALVDGDIAIAATYRGSDTPCSPTAEWFAPAIATVLRYSPAGDLRWAISLPYDPSGDSFGSAIAAGDGGSVFVTGRGSAHFGSRKQSVLVARINAGGHVAWRRQIDLAGDAAGRGVAVRGKAVLVAGDLSTGSGATARERAFLMALDAANGETALSRTLWSPDRERSVDDLAFAADGTLLLAGRVYPTAPGGTDPGSGWLARLTRAGEEVWSVYDRALDGWTAYVGVAEGAAGAIAVAGSAVAGSGRGPSVGFVRLYRPTAGGAESAANRSDRGDS